MLKTISAALLVASMLAAPAMAAGAARTNVGQVTGSATFNGKHLNSHVPKAEVHMKRHHARHYHHHRHHVAKNMHVTHLHRR